MTLIYLGCAWVAGIFFGSMFTPPLAVVFTGLIPLPLLFFLRHHRKLIILSSLCLAIFLGGAAYFRTSLPDAGKDYLQFYNDHGTVEIRGMVDAAPEVGDESAQLRLSATEIKLDKGWQEVKGAVLLFVPLYPAYNYGDLLMVTGELKRPSQLDDFDYEGYLAH